MTDPTHSDSPLFTRHNPITGEIASRAAALTPAAARRIADRAHAAFGAWSRSGPNARRARLLEAAAALEAKADAFVAAMIAEVGATEGWARFNVQLAAGMLREAAALTTHITGTVIPSDKPGCLSMALREPAGVVLGIAPWNAPVILGVRALATPLACGNSAILKASERCPQTHSLIAEALSEAGLSNGEVGLVTHAPQDAGEVVGALIDHPAVTRINFTGSTAVGRLIAKRAAEHPKPVLLELGGKAPMLVLDDADLDEAVRAAAFGAFMNQGQICMSTERIIVDQRVADAFVERFTDKANTLATGDPRQGSAPLGAVVGAQTASTLERLQGDAIAKGAELKCGGAGAGVLIPATVLDRVTPEMELFRTESFGPIVAIIRARDDAHAVELANDSEYGLAAAVFSQNAARALTVARQIRSGICHVNGATVHDEAQMPFGGVKASGYGRFGGQAGVDAFTDLRWISIATEAGQFPF